MENRETGWRKPWSSEQPIPLPGPFKVGTGRTAVQLALMEQGRDFLVLITGGAAHVGAVGVCDGRTFAATGETGTGVLEVPGHREGPLAAEAAKMLAEASGRTCTAVVGIHQDEATAAEIQDIVVHVRTGLAQIVAAFREGKKA